jgi:hypothetical protein
MRAASIRRGVAAGLALSAFYVLVVWGASGSSEHVLDQARRDWYFLALVVGGFGTQVAILSELRRRRLERSAAIAGATGVGASTAGMVACCAHHVADLAPLIGATGVAAFLTSYRLPFVVVGILVNAVAVTIGWHRLHDAMAPPSALDDEEVDRCGVAA